MNAIKKIFSLMLALTVIVSCQDDDHELGRPLSKSEVDFEVTQDLAVDPGGNTVILRNNTPGTISMWDYGTGRSTRQEEVIHFAFKGDYVIKFSALTAGGVVEMDPVTIHVTEHNTSYVSGDMWTNLTGGIGQEKTWILDYGEHGIFDGPLSYYEPLTNWESIANGTAVLGWAPSWKDNQWIIPAADQASTMTFSLDGGPFMKTHKVGEGVDESGTYFLNTEARTLTTTDATILRSPSFIANATNWNNNLVILALDENQLRVGVRRTNSEGDYLYVWNYISKEYADNYVPEDPGPKPPDEGFNPTFQPGELAAMLTGGANSGRFWKLDGAGNPVDWIAKGNGWTTSQASSRDWGWNDTWVNAISNSWIRFDSFGGQNYSRFQNGTLTSGTFTIDESTNEIILTGNTLLRNPGHWMDPNVNKIKVVKAFKTDVATKGIWFGTSYDEAKDEWFAFHYVFAQ